MEEKRKVDLFLGFRFGAYKAIVEYCRWHYGFRVVSSEFEWGMRSFHNAIETAQYSSENVIGQRIHAGRDIELFRQCFLAM